MKLLYTLRYGSYSGNCGGDLRLFFTTQNSADWKPLQPPDAAPGLWLHPQNVPETLNLPWGDTLTFSLYPITDGMPAQLYLFGAITAHTAAGQVGMGPIGNSSGLFAPNKPHLAILKGRDNHSEPGVSWDIGFDLAVPWNGISADCLGHWWTLWHKT